MSGGEIAALIAAAAFVLLVLILAIPLLKLGRVLDETTKLVAGVSDRTVPLLGEVTTSVGHVNTELVRVDAIATSAQAVTSNVAALTSLFAATLGGPVVKVAAFSYGVRKAAQTRQRGEVERRVKDQMRAERRGRRGGSRRAG